MGAGAGITITNWANRPVNIAVSNVNNMGHGTNPMALGVTLAQGQSVLPTYLESSGIGLSTFNLTFTFPDIQQTIGHVNFTEDSDSYGALNDNPSVLMCTYFNPVGGPMMSASISITVLPFVLNWTTWMSGWPELGNLPLSRLCIPGTHDSGTYELQPFFLDSGVEGAAASTLRQAAVQTQTQSVGVVPNFLSQLNYGARYFDLRPGGLLGDPNLFANPLFHVHSPNTSTVISCAQMQEILSGVAAFAQQNPKELIILNFSHLSTSATNTFTFINPYTGQPVQNASAAYSLKFLAASQIYNTLADANVLLSPVPVMTTTLNEVWATRKNVICLFDCTDGITFGDGSGQINIPDATNLFWQITDQTPYLTGWNTYANQDNPWDLLDWLTYQLTHNQVQATPGTLSLLQCQCTPSTYDSIAPLYSVIGVAQQSNAWVTSQIGIHFAPTSPVAQNFAQWVNIFLTDAFDGTATNWAVACNLYQLSHL